MMTFNNSTIGLYSILYGLNCIELYLDDKFFKMAAMKLILELSLLDIMYFNPIDDMTSASNLNVLSSFCRYASEISEMKNLMKSPSVKNLINGWDIFEQNLAVTYKLRYEVLEFELSSLLWVIDESNCYLSLRVGDFFWMGVIMLYNETMKTSFQHDFRVVLRWNCSGFS